MFTLDEYEHQYWATNQAVCGLDEAGRGPLAGPLVVAVCQFPLGYHSEDIYDSKKLTEKKREVCFQTIIKDATFYQIEIVPVEVIDQLNIYRATQEAMERLALAAPAPIVLTDAMPLPQVNKTVIDLVKGDQKSVNIAAASILAKVCRDHIMMGYDHLYPEYGFAQHKGYPTKAHLEALSKYGVLPIHRKSYGPVAAQLQPKLDLD